MHIPVVAVAMLESRVANCVHCVENVEIILINNKSPFVASSWSHTYLLKKMHGHSNIKITSIIYPVFECVVQGWGCCSNAFKSKDRIVPMNTMKAYGGVEV